MDYTSVEIGILNKNKDNWIKPESVKFRRIQMVPKEPIQWARRRNDDIIRYVPVSDLVADLADFFDCGGMIDASHDEIKGWVDKIVEAVQ